MTAGVGPVEGVTDWRLVAILYAAGLGAAAQYGKASVAFEVLRSTYAEAGANVGFAVSLVGVVGIVLGVVAGLVVARFGYRRALVWALVGGAAVSALQALVPPFGTFLVLRLAEGVSHLAIVVAAPTLIAEVSAPRHRGMALTIWGTFFGVAFAILAVLGRPLAETAGLGALMAAHGSYMAVMALLVIRHVPKDPPRAGAAFPVRNILHRTIRIYRTPRIGAPAAGWLFYTFSFVSLLTLVPPYIASGLRAPVTFAMPLVSIAASLTVGVALLRVLPAVAVVQIGFVGSAVCAVALAAIPGQPALCLAIAAALGLVQGASFAAVPQLNSDPEDRALANGGLAQSGNVGNTLGVPVLAATIAGFGAAGLFLPLAAALAAGALALAVIAPRRG
jgi:MFS family permease